LHGALPFLILRFSEKKKINQWRLKMIQALKSSLSRMFPQVSWIHAAGGDPVVAHDIVSIKHNQFLLTLNIVWQLNNIGIVYLFGAVWIQLLREMRLESVAETISVPRGAARGAPSSEFSQCSPSGMHEIQGALRRLKVGPARHDALQSGN
jgi:hypothetical protein